MKTNINLTALVLSCTWMLSANACSPSHHEATDAGLDSGDLLDASPVDASTLADARTDAPTETDLGMPMDGGGLDACSTTTCYLICHAIGPSTCASAQSTPSNCDGTCPSGFAKSTDCSDLILMCPDADAGTIDLDGGIPEAWTLCEQHTDCEVTARTCCGLCGVASGDDMVAVNDAYVDDYRGSACSAGSACPACFAEQDPNLVAVCESNRCVARDLRTTVVSACNSAAECQVRTATCCECGAASTGPWLSINSSQESEYESIVCAPGDCAGGDGPGECTEYPTYPMAACTGDSVTSGFCFLDWGAD